MSQDRAFRLKMNPGRAVVSLLLLVLNSLLLAGCSSGPSSNVIPYTGPQSLGQTTSVPLQEGFQREPLTLSDIEVVWEVEDQEVDFFWVRYGFQPDQIEHTVKVAPQDLHRETDPLAGELYVFFLRDVPTSASVFIQIASEQQGVVSPFSQVFSVEGDQ